MAEKNEIMVSICCTTYNHQDFIEDALKGFVMQKTNFDYEVIVHDDASTDLTAEIVRRYEKEYPNLIRPIYQKENKYSQKIPITPTYVLPEVRGKYIALCEGDDFWIDEKKLQLQIDYMELNSNCVLCCHAHKRIDIYKNTLEVKRIFKYDSDISTEDCLSTQKFPQLCTYVYRKAIFYKMPGFFVSTPVGDVTLLAYCAINGNVHYIDRVMSCYRVRVPGSWTSRFSNNKTMREDHRNSMKKFYYNLNEYTNHQYNEILDGRLSRYNFNNYWENGEYYSAMKEAYFKNRTCFSKSLLLARLLYPNNISIFKKIKLFLKRMISMFSMER